jgi:hypothetical protein
METTFENAKVKDLVYIGVKPFTIKSQGAEGFAVEETDLYFKHDGSLMGWPEIGQIVFWEPIHIVAPPRPKRKVKVNK